MTTADAFHAQCRSAQGAMGFQGLEEIGRAGGMKTAMRTQQRAEQIFVATNEPGKQFDHDRDSAAVTVSF